METPPSATTPALKLTLAELERRVLAVAPDAFLVEEHIVRRAVREERGIAGSRTFVPHTHCAAVPAEVVAQVSTLEELGRPLPTASYVLLLPRPDDVAESDPDETLRETWRALYHACLDRSMMIEVRAGRLGRERLLAIVDQIGQLPMDEARTVLAEEGLTGVGSDATRELVELVATWFELKAFAPDHLARWFPSLVGRAELEALFDGLVPAAELLQQTRLEGAPAPVPPKTTNEERERPEEVLTPERLLPRAKNLLLASQKTLERGHDVAAAVLAFKARRGAPDEAARAQALALTSLGKRLATLDPDHADDADEWPAALAPLMVRASWGMARVEARLLHDLEKACVTAEQPIWDIDLGRWLRSFGRRPLRRNEVIRTQLGVVRSLMRARGRVPLCRLDEAERRRLRRLLDTLASRLEKRFREVVSRILDECLASVGLVPRDVPEQVARDKIIAELIDRMLQRGFIAFGDVRDLLARNQLKLTDLSGPKQWLVGDPLLRLDKACRERLDAAYRHAEFYRRAFHRLSSMMFANAIGRFIVLYALLPALGSFILVEGFDHTVMAVLGWVFGTKLHISSIPLLVVAAVVIFGLIHSETLRVWSVRALKGIGRGLEFTFVTLPKRFQALPPIAALLRTRAWEIFREHVRRPAFFAVLPTFIVVVATGDSRMWLFVGVPLLVAFSAWFTTKSGRAFTESSRDWLVVAAHDLQHELVPGLIAVVLAFFKAVIERVEIVLYTVDNWLRHRQGDSRVGLVLKAGFGLLWSIVAYIVRLSVSLVAEPQLNPIKHFPVVTVTHKVTLPLSGVVATELSKSLGHAWGNFLGLGVFQLVVPGIAGFLVWEFKENWRLYDANRHKALRSVVVGSHGEPVYRLLRLGFHSGTVPRIFRKLRKAERKQNARDVRKQIEELHHIEEAMEHFVERELKRLLELSGRFPEAAHLHVDKVRLTPFRIAIDIACAPLGEPLQLTFEEQSRFLVAGIVKRGFLTKLDSDQTEAFERALVGLYMLSGVDFVREHIEALLPTSPGGTRYDIDNRGLVVWPAGFSAEIIYRLHSEAPVLVPQVNGEAGLIAPAIAASDLYFKRRALPWSTWTRLWQPPA